MGPVTTPQGVALELTPMDRTAIDTYLIHMEQLEKANDWRNLGLLLTEDCVTMPPRHSAIEGRETWIRWIDEMEFEVQDFSLRPQEFDGCGDLAFVRCDYRWTYTLKDHPEPVRDSGKFMGVLRKQPDESWLATHWMWNSDLRRS